MVQSHGIKENMPLPTLAKCARCKELFARENGPVCPQCWAQEEAEYGRIREIMEFRQGLTVPEVAVAAQVSLDVVTRMLDAGHLVHHAEGEAPHCGRCGAPAISHSKRLCQACLIRLDQDCAEAMRELRARMSGFSDAGAHQVHASLSAIRKGRVGRRLDTVFADRISSTAPVMGNGGRMVAPRNWNGHPARSSKAGG